MLRPGQDRTIRTVQTPDGLQFVTQEEFEALVEKVDKLTERVSTLEKKPSLKWASRDAAGEFDGAKTLKPGPCELPKLLPRPKW